MKSWVEAVARSCCVAFALGGLAVGMVMAGPPEVALAGFAYSGDASTIESRFPHSRRYEAA